MNVFIFEAKREIKQSILWLFGLIGVQAVFLLGMYGIFMDSQVNMTEVLQQFPEPLRKAFAIQVDSFYEFEGFYGFGMLYVTLIAVIMSLSLSISVFSREKRAKCTDFIMTKPLRKEMLFFIKTMVVLVELAINHLVFLVFSGLFYHLMQLETVNMKGFLMATSGIFFLEIVFLFFGATCSVLLKKIRSVSGTAVLIGFSVFILNAVINLLEKESLNFLAFLKYFDAEYIMKHNQWEISSLLLCIFFTVISFIPAFWFYVKGQVKALN